MKEWAAIGGLLGNKTTLRPKNKKNCDVRVGCHGWNVEGIETGCLLCLSCTCCTVSVPGWVRQQGKHESAVKATNKIYHVDNELPTDHHVHRPLVNIYLVE